MNKSSKESKLKTRIPFDPRKLKEGEYGYAVFPSGRIVKVTDRIIDSLSYKSLSKLCPAYQEKLQNTDFQQFDNCPLSSEDREAIGKALLKRKNQHHLVRSLYRD